jgi:3',5'-cyclic AMP phosphodiesterase CpdA
MLLAQISDLHVVAKGRKFYDRIDTPAFLARAVAHLNALDPRPDFVWITGDLVDQGSPAEYAHLRDILAGLQMRWAVMPGNHDERSNLRQAFDETRLPRTGEFLQYAIDDLPLRLLALDTLIPGESSGRLCQARLDWLSDRLEERPERPTIIAMHHPPFLTDLTRWTRSTATTAPPSARSGGRASPDRAHRLRPRPPPMVIRWNARS